MRKVGTTVIRGMAMLGLRLALGPYLAQAMWDATTLLTRLAMTWHATRNAASPDANE